MSGLLRLPSELLEQIYHYLGSVDDVHHFGRTCKATSHVILRRTVYIEIMRAVIGRAPQHRFDISLSRLLDLHRDIVQHLRNGNGLPPTQLTNAPPHHGVVYHPLESQLVSAVTDDCPHGPCTECLSDERCYEILARYRGMRFLENEWLVRPLHDGDLLSADHSNNEGDFLQMYHTIIERDQDFSMDNAAVRESIEIESYDSFNADQRSRFYSAATSVWLLNEIRWVLAQFTYTAPSFDLQIHLLEICKEWVAKKSLIPLMDELDRYAVFKFMYHHLLPLHGSFLSDRCSSRLPLTFPSELEKSSVWCTRFLQLFLIAGQTYLQPPDLIDLIVRSRISRTSPYPLLTTPASTDHWRHPALAHAFAPNLHYATGITASNQWSTHVSLLLMQKVVTHLNIINRATLNQTESHPQRHWVDQPADSALFVITDESATFFKEKALVQFEAHAKRTTAEEKLKDIRKVFQKQWSEIWWSIWWWANSEEKARAKIERWRRT